MDGGQCRAVESPFLPVGIFFCNLDLMDDLDLIIKRILAGEDDLYAQIVEEYESKVLSVIAAMIPDRNRVADITQDTFVTAYQNLHKYQPRTNFLAWIRTIARNMAQNERRRWYRSRDAHERYRVEIEDSVEDEINNIVDTLPEDVLDSLRGCVDGLGDKTRGLVDGFYFKDSAIKELAELLDLSVSTVKVTLHRARDAIGKCMRRKGHGNVG